MLEDIWLVQPLAFARGGNSPEPLDAYDWGPNDLTPRGTGRTTVLPAETLAVAEDGTVTARPPAAEIRFKDDAGRVKPVCPFFELWATWNGEPHPVTPDLLAAAGARVEDLAWSVTFRNIKAFHWTRAQGDIVEATLTISGTDTARHALLGASSHGADGSAALVPPEHPVAFGFVQLTRPTADFPEFRLRFTPAQGLVHGPTNLADRLAAIAAFTADRKNQPLYANPLLHDMIDENVHWAELDLAAVNCTLNAAAAWPNYALFTAGELNARLLALLPDAMDIAARAVPQMSSQLLRFIGGPDADLRNLPPGLYGWAVEPPDRIMSSLGLIDDFGDGIITCTLARAGAPALTAEARIVTAPPIWAPDRRPVTTLADGLADRVDRASVRDPAYAEADVTDAEMRDLLDRAFETVGLANIDVLNAYFADENASWAARPGEEYSAAEARAKLWTGRPLESPLDLPLTAQAVDRHRRNTVDIFFDAFLAHHPDFMQKFVRMPAEPQRLYDRRMPGLMRGADRRPITLTRRQYDVLAAWVARIQKDAQ